MNDYERRLTAGSMASSMSSMSMPELPNLPGVRRDLSLINPKLYRDFKKSLSQESLQEEPMPRVEEENSLLSFFESSDKMHEYSKMLSPFPNSGESYNDISGRYSLISQQQDRLKKSRSLPYSNTNNLPLYITNDGRVCSFIAYFTEIPREGIEDRSRVVFIKYFMEDSSIEMIEPRVENSGTSQGKFLKRHQVFKTNTKTLFTLDDFYCGAEINIYHRIYKIIDCDNGTKKILEARGKPFGKPISLPGTVYDPKSRAGLSRAAPRTSTSNMSLASKNKDYFQYDTKVLRFYGVWDCRNMLFGDEINVKLHYILAENKIEVVPINSRNSGRDRLPKLLKKTSIMKPPTSPLRTGEFDFDSSNFPNSPNNNEYNQQNSPNNGHRDRGNGNQMSVSSPTSRGGMSTTNHTTATPNTATLQQLSEQMQPTSSYHWTDLKVGLVIPVASMTILICDADEFTREFYNCKNMPLDAAIKRPQPEYPVLQTTIPPYNGFGSEEDSLQTCKQTLVLSAPTKDGAKMKQLANMILRYEAIMADPQEVDKDRKFIIQVHLEDDTFQIREPPIRNSGHKGGIFLSRCKLESHNNHIKPLQPSDIYLGATIEILSHQFIILNCDIFTFKYMAENSKLWIYSNITYVLKKVTPKKEIIQRIILTLPNLTQHKLTIDILYDLLIKAGLTNLVKQEVCTLFHAVDLTQQGSIKTTQFLKYLMDL